MRRFFPALAAVAVLVAASVPAPAQNLRVDLELVLAVDISGSVDFAEGLLQRQGYIDAFTNPKLLQAIRNGPNGRIAVTYLEWAGWGLFRQLVDWTVISDEQSARAFTRQLDGYDGLTGRGTSISGALDIAMQLFAMNPFRGNRRVIDVSGDGPNNQGLSMVYYRDYVVSKGVTINGLPILTLQGNGNGVSDLDVYYRECVIGGPGAFVIAAENFATFADAILRKMILEIAEAEPTKGPAGGTDRAVIKVQFLRLDRPGGGGMAVTPGGEDRPKYYPNCDISNNGRGQQFPFPGFGFPGLFGP